MPLTVALADQPVDVDWYTTRERDRTEVLPWDHLDSGLDKDWLWQDWQDSLSDVEVEDCRWTPCFDCGVCDTMGTDIQVGPTGRTLLPLTVVELMARQPDAREVAPAVQRLAGALRQARPAPLHQPSRLPAGVRTGDPAGRGAGRVQRRILAAPEDLLRRRGLDRRGE